MKEYDIDKFPHYEYEFGDVPFIGCCCQCTHHHAVNSHPWHNGKDISTTCLYVCFLDYDDSGRFILSSKHGGGCEMFEGDKSWEDIELKHKVLRELKS